MCVRRRERYGPLGPVQQASRPGFPLRERWGRHLGPAPADLTAVPRRRAAGSSRHYPVLVPVGICSPARCCGLKTFSCKDGRARSSFWTLKPRSLQTRPDDLQKP